MPIEYKLSKEHRMKISKALKGRKLSREHKMKISEALRGRKFSDEHCRKISEANMGHIHSEEHKRKIRESNRGVRRSEETKKRISEALRGRECSEETRKKIGTASRGRKHSEKTRRKMSKSHSGERCWRWKGGITSENQKIRSGIEFRLWREAVFARDNWTCQKCGDKKGGNLRAHHIRNFAECLELRTSIENGITLCVDCHNNFHNKYGYTKNGKEQLGKFLCPK